MDILVEYRYAHHDFKLIIECRDRARKESVEWIDGLIGKAQSLAVNKVVAVSKEGFCSTALKKALVHGIETLTIEEAVETDWEKYPFKPGIIVFTSEQYSLHDVLFKDGENFRSLKELDLDSIVMLNGQEFGTIKETFEYFFSKILLPHIQQKHIKFNELLVSTGQHLDFDGSILKFQIVQDPETKKVHAKWKRKKNEDT